MAFDKKDLKLGAVVGLASVVLAYLFKEVLKGWGATITFATYDINVRQQLESGIGATPAGGLADKILGYMSGVIPSGTEGYLTIFLTGLLIVVIGKYAVNLSKLKAKNELWLIMLAGTAVASFVMSYTSVLTLKFFPVLVGMALYFAIVTAAIQLLIKQNVVPKEWVSI